MLTLDAALGEREIDHGIRYQSRGRRRRPPHDLCRIGLGQVDIAGIGQTARIAVIAGLGRSAMTVLSASLSHWDRCGQAQGQQRKKVEKLSYLLAQARPRPASPDRPRARAYAGCGQAYAGPGHRCAARAAKRREIEMLFAVLTGPGGDAGSGDCFGVALVQHLVCVRAVTANLVL